MKWTWIIVGVAVLYLVWGAQNASASDTSDDDSTDGDGSIDGPGSGSADMTIEQLFQAVSQQENVAAFHNNPAALTPGPADEVGASYTPNTTGGVVVNFATLQDGINAGMAFLQNFVDDHSDLTVIQAFATYINGPHAESTITGAQTGIYPASVTNYATGIASALGVSISATLGSIFGQ